MNFSKHQKKCFVVGCEFDGEIEAAHVVKVGKHYDNLTYIIPLCHEHNVGDYEELVIPSYKLLQPANQTMCIRLDLIF